MNRTEQTIKDHYTKLINESSTLMEAKMLEGEMNYKLRLLDEGIDTVTITDASDSDYECFGCGS